MFRDLRLAFRTLLRAPAFGVTVIVTLALGIGATTALFTVVNAVLLDPLPFPASRQLVQVWRSELPALTYGSASYLRYLDWRQHQRAFSDIGALAPRAVTVSGGDAPERANGAVASASFFKVVGAAPALGTWIRDVDDRPGGERVVVISHGYWTRRFGGAENVIGQTLTIDGQPYSIIGVAPASYAEVFAQDLFLPLTTTAASTNRDSNFLQSFGRMREGGTIDSARRSLSDLAAEMTRQHAIDKYGFTARPLHEVVTERASEGLWVLLGATSLLLLIACANVANLLLARSVQRQREMAIRASLGGTRARLVGQVCAEAVAIGACASVVGAGLAWGIVRAFIALAPANFPRLGAIAIDWRVLAFAGGVALMTALVAGLAPMWSLLRWDMNTATRGDGGRAITSARARAASRALVIVEMSLAFALVAAAGLLAKSIMRLDAQDLGFTRQPVLTFGVGLPPFAASDNAAFARVHGDFLTELRSLTGITNAAAINLLPIARTGSNGPVRKAEDPNGPGVPVTEFRCVTDGYFETMDMRLLAGRAIDARDKQGTTPVTVVNEVVATRLFPGVPLAQVVGRGVRIGWLGGLTVSEVVGVSASVRSRRPDAQPDPEVYVPFAQVPTAAMSYVVRSAGDVSAMTAPIREALGRVAPGVPLATVRTLEDIVSTSTRMSRLISWLSVVFAALAAALAVLGVYSVLSYAVAQRTREFAIRSAVGATRGTLVASVMREGALLSGVGIAGGIGLALLSSGLLSRLLFGVSTRDAFVFGAAAIGLATVAAAGYFIPATRASKADPIGALRGE
jgi:putative ABC transport system permease protein